MTTLFHRLVHWTLAGVLLALLGGISGARPQPAPARVERAGAARLTTAYDRAGLKFERNDGQADPAVRYLSRANGYTAFLTDAAATLVYKTARGNDAQYAVLRYQLRGAQPSRPVAGDELPDKSHYFIGPVPARGHKDVPTYGRITYPSVYTGVDLTYYGPRGALQYDFTVAAGADPGVIRLHITGADRLDLEGGDLLMHTAAGIIRQSAPVIYQIGAAGRESVPGGFALSADGTIGFNLGRYDGSRPLIIDPVVLAVAAPQRD